MAHELAFTTDADGRRVAQMFSVKETPWHREGRVLTEAPDFDVAAAMAGHNFAVEAQPLYRKVPTPGVLGAIGLAADYVESDYARVTVRTDTGAELGGVGMGYHVVQNADAFAPLRPLVEAGAVSLETGGTLRGGADVWLSVRFAVEHLTARTRDVFGSEVVPFGLIANNHAGRRGVLVKVTPVRVVCANTLGQAEGGAGGAAQIVRHTAGAPARVAEAAEQLLAGMVTRFDTVAQQYDALKRTTLTPDDFEALVLDVATPDPRRERKWNPAARAAAAVVERAEKRRAHLVYLWEGAGDGHAGDHSAWEAYNSVTQAIDHNGGNLWPDRAGVRRTASLMGGVFADIKQAVLNRLVAYAAERSGR